MKKKTIIIIFSSIILGLLIIISIILFNNGKGHFVKMVGNSMYPTYKNGDVIIVYEGKTINRGDIILFKYESEKLIKRVIGIPKDIIEYKDNTLYINNQIVEEKYLEKGTITEDFNQIIDDCYFVMGDNREISLDSRMFGCIKKEDIIGVAKSK